MENPYKRAEVRLRARRDFLIHLGIFLFAAPFLLLLDWLADPARLVSGWLILVWILGLVLHALSLFEPLKRLIRLLDRLSR